jgi:hypothetical protein
MFLTLRRAALLHRPPFFPAPPEAGGRRHRVTLGAHRPTEVDSQAQPKVTLVRSYQKRDQHYPSTMLRARTGCRPVRPN